MTSVNAAASTSTSSAQPEILLYDSPTGGLDPITSTRIVELIVKQRDVFQTSSLLVTHRLQDGFMMASHYFDPQSNLIDVHISRLRQAIDKGAERPLIHTIRGSGYVLRSE